MAGWPFQYEEAEMGPHQTPQGPLVDILGKSVNVSVCHPSETSKDASSDVGVTSQGIFACF